MKRNRIFMLIGFALLIFSCEKDLNKESSKSEMGANISTEVFTPTEIITVKNGILWFDSQIAFDITKNEIAMANPLSLKQWTESLGIETYLTVFHEIILKEDSISNHYENLPLEYQMKAIDKPQIHSELYKNSIMNGIIREQHDFDGNKYFDLNLYDRSVAGVINLDGLVIIDGQIHQYGANFIKIILDGDFSEIIKLKDVNEPSTEGNIVAFYAKPATLTKDVILGYNWSQTRSWVSTGSRTRVRVWIDGSSKTWNNAIEPNCTRFLECRNIVRAEAQRKNFWGNWVYTGNYTPSFSFNASWSYSYRSYVCDPYFTYGCGIYDCELSNFPAYSCTPNPDYMCPTSPYSGSWNSVNNAFINLTPHGIWESYPKFFSDAIRVGGVINAWIDGKYFYFNWER
jgi:hypothetical protein